jgi:superfamily II RNA helicase
MDLQVGRGIRLWSLSMPLSLFDHLPTDGGTTADALLGAFLAYAESRGLSLYPAQEEAILEVFEGKNVILNTPTGSGKSLVASAMAFGALAAGRRFIYTCPIKALVNEKWMALCKEFGPANVGLSTGDATVNRDALILCCTAEILANMALCEGTEANVLDVVMDEFHYYADRERGFAWQVPLLALPQTRFLLMSATLGDTSFFETELTRLNGLPTVGVKGTDRPVPLAFTYAELPLASTLENLLQEGKGPIYVVHFTQAEAAASAQDFTSLAVTTREEKTALAAEIGAFKFNSPYGADLKRWLRAGIGLHHAGLLPKYRILVERLAQKGLLKVICGTDTLGVGINVPIRTVLFTKLCKYSGQKTSILTARDFHQISGRAGRKGFDTVGYVVAQAPEHVIENMRLSQKPGKKFVKRPAPDRNFALWDKTTFEKLQAAAPERLVSRFQVNHAMLLHVLSRRGDGCLAMRQLIRDSHETAHQKSAHFRRGWQLFKTLVVRRIVEFIPPDEHGRKVRVNLDLQADFGMDETLSLYLLDTIPLLDPESPDYAFDLLTLVESIVEDPDFILRSQLHKLKGEAVAEMKMAGIEYDQRMEELEKLEYPKPLREFIYATFNEFADKHPWVGQENIRPKSIAREMFERYLSFADYVRNYELQRAEGLLLRHLNSTYKVLARTVPDAAKTDEVREMEAYLGALLRQVDSSLLDAWEQMQNPAFLREEETLAMPGAEDKDITRDRKAFTAAIRARLFAFLHACATEEWDEALALLTSDGAEAACDGEGVAWTADRLKACMSEYRANHDGPRLDPEGRNRRHTYMEPKPEAPRILVIQQMLVDAEGDNDWALEVEADLDASRVAGQPVLRLVGFGAFR